MAYPPTSLDFINRPNPVEPHAGPEKHPLHGTPRLEQTSKDEFLRMLLDENSANATTERPAKRRKSGDATSTLLALPKLPAVKNGVKRMRIPPILRGLHQPPPDAGLLPSISVDHPVRLANATGVAEAEGVAKTSTTTISSQRTAGIEKITSVPPKTSSTTAKVKRNKWSNEETSCLLKGVARFGIGNWTRILRCPDYTFNNRTAIDIKDRFRICCPSEYRSGEQRPARPASEMVISQQRSSRTSQPAESERKAKLEMQSIGIDEPFERSRRRPRKRYTEAEDAALLAGFQLYGNSWISIQNDPTLGLSGRTPTDIRDRVRTKYPDLYRNAGLAPRPDVFPKKPERQDKGRAKVKTGAAATEISTTESEGQIPKPTEPSRPQKENKGLSPKQVMKPKRATSILQFDDVFWGAPLDEEDEDLDRPTLDRQILDWPFEPRATTISISVGNETNEASSSRPANAGANLSSNPGAGGILHGAALPSLAAITSGGDDFTMQLELPTLVSVLGSLDEQGRGGGQIPSLEELLS